MEILRNLPEDPKALGSLIDIRPGRVVSMNLSRSETMQLMLMAVAEGEEVTSEQYPGDLLYYVIEGEMPVSRGGVTQVLHAGEIMAIPAGEPHAIGGSGSFKLLQLIITK